MTVRKGPPPVPNEAKRRRGTLKPSRVRSTGAELVPLVGGRPDLGPPPEHLQAEGAAAWRMLLADVPWLAPSDVLVVLLVAELYDRRSALLAAWDADNRRPTLYTDSGYCYPHPVLGLLRGVEADISRHLQLLGLTPSDRTRIGLGEVKRASKLEELIARRNEQAGA